MKQITLQDMTQEAFDAAAETVISGIKAYNRRLDTRDGTVLRDLLVNPEAAIEGVLSGQIDEMRKSSSLKRLKEAQEAGEDVDQDDVDAILSNFNVRPTSGSRATGLVKVVVSDGTVAYSVSEGDVFTTSDGVSFTADYQVVAARQGMSGPALSPNAVLYGGASGYFFLVPATASENGAAGNIAQGTALTPESPVTAFVMAEAYKDFGGGADVESLSSVVARIPTGLSIRGFVTKTAAEGMLRDRFDDGDHPIVAVSAVGYGNDAMVRDRHNAFGIAVGGRVDLYVRNFSNFVTQTERLSGTRTGDGTYTVNVPASVFPGACWIKSVSDPFTSSDGDEDVLGSLSFEAERTAELGGTWHDIDVSDGPAEAFNTVWQGFALTLSDVPADKDDGTWSETRDFKVTAYVLPQAVELQEYVDRDDVRSIATDVVVRCPVVCNVSVKAYVTYDTANPVDEGVARAAVRTYINGRGFVGRITRSEIVQIIKNLGAASVEMPLQDMLSGVLHDADGTRRELRGDAIDVTSVTDGRAMLTKDTVVFCAEDANIEINLTPNA